MHFISSFFSATSIYQGFGKAKYEPLQDRGRGLCMPQISKTAVDLDDFEAEAVMVWAELASKSCVAGHLFTMEVE